MKPLHGFLLFLLCVAGLASSTRPDTPMPPGSAPLPVVAAQTRHNPELMRPPSRGCYLLKEMLHLTGQRARDCSVEATHLDAFACANESLLHRIPFTFCEGGWGMDSRIESGVAGLTDGSIVLFYFDTMGARFKGSCAARDVILAEDGWPLCRRALSNVTSLSTHRPLDERILPADLEWSADCAQLALEAPTDPWAAWPRFVDGYIPQVTDPAVWGKVKTMATFEIVVGGSGRAECVRIIDAAKKKQPREFYESIRKDVMRWKFEPPTLYGHPVIAHTMLSNNLVQYQRTKLAPEWRKKHGR
jgi:hypothetical protein